MYYSLKGYINFKDPQKVLDAINQYTTLRVNASLDGLNNEKVQFETVLTDVSLRDSLANKIENLITSNGGYVIFSECVQNADDSIGSCTMTHKFYNDATVTNPGNSSNK